MLPDVKVVRTSFFVNGCALVVTCALLIFFVYREYEIASVKDQVASWEERIAERGPQSEEVLELGREFAAEKTKVDELLGFVAAPVSPSEFLAAVARTVPDRVVITRLSRRDVEQGPRVALSGRVQGISEEATDILSAYERLFTEDDYFSRIVGDVDVTSVTRNPETDTLSFNFVLHLEADNEE